MSNPNGLPEDDLEIPGGEGVVDLDAAGEEHGTHAVTRSGPNTVPQGGNDTE